MGEINVEHAVGHGQPAGIADSGDGPAGGSARLGSYLRKLREGYGYTLRKVEERAMALGEAIDNSQLSRFEKGKAVPSFDKLRALARVFNVPVQSFSDVLDLEEYQHLDRPEDGDFADLLRRGAESLARGDHGRAFVIYERALDLAESGDGGASAIEMAAEARWRMACALKALGKLYMTEYELREVLKLREKLPPRTRLRALLELGYLYRELGDLYLASVLAKECLALAADQGDLPTQAGVLNTLGNVAFDSGSAAEALTYYERSRTVLDQLEGYQEMKVKVLTNLGGCLASAGRADEGLGLLQDAHVRSVQGGFRRSAALALTRLAEVLIQIGNPVLARRKLAESDALASRNENCFHDILFLNTYHRWVLARGEGNGTGEKIAFGRLRHLRSLLQRRFPEVDEFDRHVERTRR